MSAPAKSVAPECGAEDLQRISELPGATLGIEQCRFAPEQGAANLHLLLLLGELCGRLEPSGAGGYRQRGTAAGWLRLVDVDESAIEDVVRRVRRRYPEWKYDVGSAVSTIDKLDAHFATGQLRRRRDA